MIKIYSIPCTYTCMPALPARRAWLCTRARSLPMKSSNRRSECKRRAGGRGRTSLSLFLQSVPSNAVPACKAWITTTTGPHRSFPIGDIFLLSPCGSLHVSSLGPAQSHTTQRTNIGCTYFRISFHKVNFEVRKRESNNHIFTFSRAARSLKLHQRRASEASEPSV